MPLYIILQLYPKFPFDAYKLNISLIVIRNISEVHWIFFSLIVFKSDITYIKIMMNLL